VTNPNTELVEQVLAAAVEIGVGTTNAKPRPGQLALARDMADAQSGKGQTTAAVVASGRGHISGLAGVGIGKSYAGLSNAAVRAVKYGERTIYSTKSLPLQAQIVDKDAPVVSKAAERVLGKGFTTALLKGWGNYVCLNRAFELGSALLGEEVTGHPGPTSIKPLIKRIEKLPTNGMLTVDNLEVNMAEMKPLALWSLGQGLIEAESGDKDTYDGEVSEFAWKSVSVSPEECVGLDICPFADICKSDRARTKAAEADVVVTNHSMLAVQASKGVPVVLGNVTLGPFDHIIVDEAHELPKVVRSQGEAAISGRRMGGLIRLVKSVADDRNDRVKSWIDDGRQIAELIENELHQMYSATSSGEVGRLGELDDPLAGTAEGIIAWARVGSRLLKKPTEQASNNGQMGVVMASKRAQAGVDSIIADVNAVRKYHKGTARWLSAPPPAEFAIGKRRAARPWYSAQAAPVEVGGLLNANLWTQKVIDPETDEEIDISPSVSAISGTLPPGFVFDAGLSARETVEYELPFKEAYAESMLFIPSAKTDEAIAALTTAGYGAKRKFSTSLHVEWAAQIMGRLIDANEGSALVLAATTSNGRKYVELLTKHAAGRWKVYSQWDAGSPRVTLAKWKADHHSILVGTQGLMTGVDAPGDTNSLVFLDRFPRAAGNAVDDARVDLVAERMGGGAAATWTGKRLVYVADAAEKAGQSRGRLVRGEHDRGMFVCLDPRLLKNHIFTYEESARKDMMKAIDAFGQKTSDIEVAIGYLRGRQTGRRAA
jgi:ATP-dependent DNA helicase DinG